jgi:hypothetical protein
MRIQKEKMSFLQNFSEKSHPYFGKPEVESWKLTGSEGGPLPLTHTLKSAKSIKYLDATNPPIPSGQCIFPIFAAGQSGRLAA